MALILKLQYPHTEQSIHNIGVVIVLLVSYSSLLIYLFIQGAQSDNRIRMSRLQRQTFFQCFLVCIGTFITALVYVSFLKFKMSQSRINLKNDNQKIFFYSKVIL